ncbi:MAG TPA: nuclear transport factor 2 family protein [Bryobacteraceae bacterium]|nr:nuclear transport factor 2 family protein [Bryobacteraceae bacterium]
MTPYLAAVRSTIVAIAVASGALAQLAHLPPLKRQSSAEAVVKEHLAAINACDWTRILAQDPADVEIFSPGGVVAKGREAVGAMFAQVVKPFREGGICGLKFTVEHTQKAGDTINVQWRADAPFLAEPYRGADAYETKDGLMQAQVTTFKRDDVKTKQ